jgi:putative PIN family toxin of toxin-antitoxin system
MAAKTPLKVVLDTNLFVGRFLARQPRSANRVIIRSWLLTRRFQLVVSREIREEYLRIFREVLEFDAETISRWQQRFTSRRFVKTVSPKIKPTLSRAPNDDMFIAAAKAAKAQFLVTNDRDLLEINEVDKRRLAFLIVTPQQFLKHLAQPR